MIRRDALVGLCCLVCDTCKQATGPKSTTSAEAIKQGYAAGFRRVEFTYKDSAAPRHTDRKTQRWLCPTCFKGCSWLSQTQQSTQGNTGTQND